MMSIEVFGKISTLEYKLRESIRLKKLFSIIKDYYELKRFIYSDLFNCVELHTYQFIYNFIIYMRFNNINTYSSKCENIKFTEDDTGKVNYIHIDVVDKNITYDYSLYPEISPGEISFRYIDKKENGNEVRGDKTFINSLDMDPHKDNLYLKSSHYFINAKEIFNNIIKNFFIYHIKEYRNIIKSKYRIFKLIWRDKS